MTDLLKLLLAILASLFKSRAELEAEILVLRQQVNMLRRQMPKRPALTNVDHLLFVWLYRWFPSTVNARAIIRPETVIRWHHLGLGPIGVGDHAIVSAYEGLGRVARPHSRDELSELAVASAAHPRRAAQAGLRGRPVDCRQFRHRDVRLGLDPLERGRARRGARLKARAPFGHWAT
jgi:hypothetical protein